MVLENRVWSLKSPEKVLEKQFQFFVWTLDGDNDDDDYYNDVYVDFEDDDGDDEDGVNYDTKNN